MLTQIVAAKVARIRGRLKARLGQLTDDDQKVLEGMKDQLVGTLLWCGYSQEQAKQEAQAFYGTSREQQSTHQ